MKTNTNEKASAVLANRIALLTKDLHGEEINDAFGTEIAFTDSTVDQVAEAVTGLLAEILEKLDDVNRTDRPESVVKREWS